MDTWEKRQAELAAFQQANASQRLTFIDSFAFSDADFCMDGQAVGDFVAWLQHAYKRWPVETTEYIVALAANDLDYLETLQDKAFGPVLPNIQDPPGYWTP
jgi:hypothetical protein